MTAECDLYPAMEAVPGEKRMWELQEDWCVDLPGRKKGRLRVRQGFRFDGASIPQCLWSWIGSPMDTNLLRGALAHDALFTNHCGMRQATVDRILYDIIRADGVGRVKANVIWAGPRVGGRKSWNDPDRVYMKDYVAFEPACNARQQPYITP